MRLLSDYFVDVGDMVGNRTSANRTVLYRRFICNSLALPETVVYAWGAMRSETKTTREGETIKRNRRHIGTIGPEHVGACYIVTLGGTVPVRSRSLPCRITVDDIGKRIYSVAGEIEVETKTHRGDREWRSSRTKKVSDGKA